MTGFGKFTANSKGIKVTVEIRSLNSKQLDLNIRIPGVFRENENQIRDLLSKICERGKIDFSIFIENAKANDLSFINKNLAKLYYAELKALSRELKTDKANLLEMVMKLPEVMKPERAELDPPEWKLLKNCTEKALEEIDRFRRDEGKALQKELEKRIMLIEKNLADIVTLDKKRIPTIRKKLRSNIDELKGKIDENRFEQELIYYIEKMDITEEKVRLQTHIDYFRETMKEKNSGRKLNFISQEIGREINTIGSKANDAVIQKSVVQMKDELEKIKEQLNNVL